MCSEQEIKLLDEIAEKLQSQDITNNWDLTEKELIQARLFRNIRNATYGKSSSHIFRMIPDRFIKVAAAVLILIGVSYFLLNYNKDNTPSQPYLENITLQLSNGDKEILGTDQDIVIREDGTVIAVQAADKLVYEKAEVDTELIYHTLNVPFGKTFNVVLSDGSSVYLNSGSTLRYPVRFVAARDREIFVSGEIFLDVATDKDHPFIVHADQMNVQVLGTKFNVMAYPEDEVIEVVLVEGSVHLNLSDSDNQPLILEPGSKASLDRETLDLSKEEVITDIYTSWMNGELEFRNMSFKNILKKLERHYSVSIINRNDDLSEAKFNAGFGKDSLEEVLNYMRQNYGIKYRIDGKTVIIN